MKRESAEEIALQTLVWLVGQDEILPIFLGSTGLGQDEIRERAGEAEFLAAVLDFLTMNDEWVKECAHSIQRDPYSFMEARQSLPGGGDVHWT